MQPKDLPEILTSLPLLMRGFPSPWCVAGGWAIDLFLGRVTRPHGDVELAIFRADQMLLRRQFPDWNFCKVVAGERFEWGSEQHLPLPVHEIHARANKPPGFELEFLLNERAGDQWVFRRDPRVSISLDRVIRHAEHGLPILNPAIVLLYKAKNSRPKDELDFQSVCAALNEDDREWLRATLQMCHADHPWLHLLNQDQLPSPKSH